MASPPLLRSGAFVVHPATHARFDDVRTMVGPKNPTSSVCSCLSHRIAAKDNREPTGPDRGAYVEALTRRRTKPGVLAYEGDDVVHPACGPGTGAEASRMSSPRLAHPVPDPARDACR